MIGRRAKSMLSLARRAGKLISGEDAVLLAIKRGEACLVIIAEDAADNTKKRFLQRSQGRDIYCMVTGLREELGNATGLYNRAVFAVTEKGFADSISNALRG